MEIIGKVAQMLPLLTGQGKNGEWKKQEFILEIAEGQFPRKICFSLWGDKIDQAAMSVNDTVKVFFDLESREYNSRWYTDAKAWKVEKQGATGAQPIAQPATAADFAPPPAFEEGSPVDDLPF